VLGGFFGLPISGNEYPTGRKQRTSKADQKTKRTLDNELDTTMPMQSNQPFKESAYGGD
jgi:hypothetical protein